MSQLRRPPPPPSPVRAVVHAAGIATPYLRAGSGGSAVLLAGGEWRRLLLPRLAAGARVVVPEVPAVRPVDTDPSGRLAFCRWLRAFFDGLGIERAAVIAEGALSVPAVAFALVEEERVGRVVLLDAQGLDGGADAELAGRLACPVLRLRAGDGQADAAVRFVAGGD